MDVQGYNRPRVQGALGLDPMWQGVFWLCAGVVGIAEAGVVGVVVIQQYIRHHNLPLFVVVFYELFVVPVMVVGSIYLGAGHGALTIYQRRQLRKTRNTSIITPAPAPTSSTATTTTTTTTLPPSLSKDQVSQPQLLPCHV